MRGDSETGVCFDNTLNRLIIVNIEGLLGGQLSPGVENALTAAGMNGTLLRSGIIAG